MKHSFTPLFLSKFIYREISESERKSLKVKIAENDLTKREYFELLEVKKELDKLSYKPSARSVKEILRKVELHAEAVN